jgi:cytochrome d ubiquinol oxidase subunit II
MADVHFWSSLCALAGLAGVIAYALLAGADFGGGVWDLFASGPRKKEQRLAIQKAMGPVWEANHVWLIFVLVVLFTCFPAGYAALAIVLFVPFHLALLGIMLRGASFVFRSYQSRQKDAAARTSAWGIAFGVASIVSPIFLGIAFGVVTEGRIRIENGNVQLAGQSLWLSPYCLTNGLLALSACAYLAAVYLINETDGELREDFRQRAIWGGTATAVLAFAVLLLAFVEARWFFDRLSSFLTLPVIIAGLACFAGSAWSVFNRRFAVSRAFAASEVGLLILGWGLAQYPYLVYPDLAFDSIAAPVSTLRFIVWSLPFGGMLIIPSLWILFRVFKSH